MEAEKRLDGKESEMEFTPTEANIDNEFLRCIRNRKISLGQQVASSVKFDAERLSDHLVYQALPPADEMAKILRYESRVQKQRDWALQRLLGVGSGVVSQEASRARYSSHCRIMQNEANNCFCLERAKSVKR